jgi:hypothetical protein
MRSYEVLTDGSNKTEMFCQQVLEPVANLIAGEEFRSSSQWETGSERSWSFEDNVCVTISFSVQKTTQTYKRVPLLYELEVSVSRPRKPADWWPEVDDEDEDIDTTDKYDGGDEDAESDCMVREVSKYRVNEDNYAPHKEVNIEYYDDNGEYIACESTTVFEEDNIWYSEDAEEDVLLHVLEAGMCRSLSESDIVEIQDALAKLGVYPTTD